MFDIIVSIFLSIIIPITFLIILKKNKKNINANHEFVLIKQKKDNEIAIFMFYVIMLFATAGQILLKYYFTNGGSDIYATFDMNMMLWAILAMVFFCFFLSYKYNCFFLNDGEIVRRNIFQKDMHYSLSSIFYYSEISKFGHKIVTYSKNGVLLFSIDCSCINFNKFMDVLKINNVKKNTGDFPNVEIKNEKKYIEYKKKLNKESSCICIIAITTLCFFIFLYNIPLSKIRQYENSIVTGTIESYRFSNKGIDIKLSNDNNEYYVDEFLCNAVDKELYSIDLNGLSVELYIGYKDKRGKNHISQITYNEKIYLDSDLSWKYQKKNYNNRLITGCLFLILSIIFFIILIKYINDYKKIKDYYITIAK